MMKIVAGPTLLLLAWRPCRGQDNMASPRDSGGYYVWHDAAIAAGFAIGANRLTLETLRPALECLAAAPEDEVVQGETDPNEAFAAVLPGMIDRATATATTDVGHVVEYGNQAFTVGENYVVEQRSVTVTCFLDRPLNVDRPSAAYAGHLLVDILAGSGDLIPSDPDPRAYNVTMVVQADVMELETTGLLYRPRRYCLDFPEENYPGVVETTGGDSFIPISATVSIPRIIQVGTRSAVARSTVNRIGWFDTQAGESNNEVVRRAYAQPKAELVALLDAPVEDCNRDDPYLFAECLKASARDTFQQVNGFDADENALETSFLQLGSMFFDLEAWREMKYALVGAEDPSLPFLESIREQVRSTPPVALFTFAKSVASADKNSRLSATLVNPFRTQSELDMLFDDDVLRARSADLAQCVLAKEGTTTAQLSVATELMDALTRRTNEWTETSPRDRPLDWSAYGFLSDNFEEVLGLPDDPLLDQTVAWKPVSSQSGNYYELEPGNLTQRIAGRTAEWILVTQWQESSELQNVLQAQRDSGIYSEVATGAVDIENPCGQTATQADLVLFALAMILVAFGAVESVATHVRRTLLWFTKDCHMYRCRSTRSAEPKPLPVSDTQDKTQDSYMVRGCVMSWAFLAFVALYVPIVIQIIREKEIADYKTSQVGMEVQYMDSGAAINGAGAKSALVTLVHSTSHCEENYFWVLVWMLVAGASLGLCINTPHLVRAIPCCTRLPYGDNTTSNGEPQGSKYDALNSSMNILDGKSNQPKDDEEDKMEALKQDDAFNWVESHGSVETSPGPVSLTDSTQAISSNESSDPPGNVRCEDESRLRIAM